MRCQYCGQDDHSTSQCSDPPPVMSEKAEMLALADEINACTDSLTRDHLMGANVLLIITALRAAGAEPVGYGYSAEIQSAHGMHLHVSREKAGVYDTPLFLAAIPAPVPASVRETLKDACMRLQEFLDTFGELGGDRTTQVDINDWLEVAGNE